MILSCEMAAGNSIDIQDRIDTSGFYFQLGVAQVFLESLFLLVKCLILIKPKMTKYGNIIL